MCDLIIRKGEQELEVTLTPVYYLQGKSLLERERFEELRGDTTGIELKHDTSNQYDALALAVTHLHNKTSIRLNIVKPI